MTNRLDPRLDWFLDALHAQVGGVWNGIQFVVVDFNHDERSKSMQYVSQYNRIVLGGGKVTLSAPKPNVWQGKHRLSKIDYFAAANARNTAICLAAGDTIVFADDLSVPLPTWWSAVLEASKKRDTVTCGAYRKVKDLVVTNGSVTSFTDHPAGTDMRMRDLSGPPPYPCMPGWHFGCSIVAPIEAYLGINGWPEACDGLGYEDCVTGIAMHHNGWKFQYDTRMMTYESEELHGKDKPFMRWDKGQSPNDKSHAMLAMFRNARRFENYFDPPGIVALRQRVLAGEPFPIQQIPEHDWYDGMPVRDM